VLILAPFPPFPRFSGGGGFYSLIDEPTVGPVRVWGKGELGEGSCRINQSNGRGSILLLFSLLGVNR